MHSLRYTTHHDLNQSVDQHSTNSSIIIRTSFLSSHLLDIPAHSIKFRLACTNQVSYLRDICEVFVPLELPSCMRQIFAASGDRDPVDAADDAAVEGEDARALEEVFEGGRWRLC